MNYLTMIVSIMLVFLTTVNATPYPKIIKRQNAGVVFHHRQDIFVATATSQLTYVLDFPPKINYSDVEIHPMNCNFTLATHTADRARQLCRRARRLTKIFHDMIRDAARRMQWHIQETQDLFDMLSRNSRSKRFTIFPTITFIGECIGLASQSELDSLKATVVQVLNITRRAARVWQAGASHFTAALAVENERINNLVQMLEVHRTIYENFHRDVVLLYHSTEFESRELAIMIIRVVDLMFALSDIDQYSMALEKSLTGKLSPHIVPIQSLTRSLTDLAAYLRREAPYLKILHTNPRYYYAHGQYAVLRTDTNNILITIRCPLGPIQTEWQLYDVTLVPVATHGTPQAHMMLDENTVALAINQQNEHYIPFYDSTELPVSQDLDLTEKDTFIVANGSASCLTTILKGRKEDVQGLCSYNIVTKPLPTRITRLADNAILLTNVREIELRCYDSELENNTSRYITIRQSQLVQMITCDCQIYVTDTAQLVPALFQNCHPNVTQIKHLYVLNWVFLSHFFEPSDLAFLGLETLLKQNVTADVPSLLMFENDYNRTLIIDKGLSHSFTKWQKAGERDKILYSSLEDMVVDKVFEMAAEPPGFSFFNITGWMILVNLALSIGAIILAVYLKCKVGSLLAVTAGLHGSAAAQLSNLTTIPNALIYTTKPPTSVVQQLNNTAEQFLEILQTERAQTIVLYISAALSLILLMGMITTLLLRRRPSVHFTIQAEIGNARTFLRTSLVQLSGSENVYRVTAHTPTPNIKLSFCKLQVLWNGFLINHKLLNSNIGLPPRVWLNPFQYLKLRRIVREPFYVLLISTRGRTNTPVQISYPGMNACAPPASDQSLPIQPPIEWHMPTIIV